MSVSFARPIVTRTIIGLFLIALIVASRLSGRSGLGMPLGNVPSGS